MTNDYVPFCNENTGTNLPSQAAYLANPALPIGNQPGIASSSLNNKALRQGTSMAAIFAQLVSNFLGVDVLDEQNSADHAISVANLAKSTAAYKRHTPVLTSYTSGAGNHRVTAKFQVASANATATAVYSDGTNNFTVTTTIAAGTQLDCTCTGGAFPAAVVGTSATLTKVSGVGDATITYYAFRTPIMVNVKAIGAGGGAQGSGSSGNGSGTSGGNTTFGGITCSGGANGGAGGAGGTTTGANVVNAAGNGQCGGGSGGTVANVNGAFGGTGGGGVFGGSGLGGNNSGATGQSASTNTGSGGGGGGGKGGASGFQAALGGGAGGYAENLYTGAALLATYAYSIGAKGTGGVAGVSGGAGGDGADGLVIVLEQFQ